VNVALLSSVRLGLARKALRGASVRMVGCSAAGGLSLLEVAVSARTNAPLESCCGGAMAMIAGVSARWQRTRAACGEI